MTYLFATFYVDILICCVKILKYSRPVLNCIVVVGGPYLEAESACSGGSVPPYKLQAQLQESFQMPGKPLLLCLFQNHPRTIFQATTDLSLSYAS